MKRYIKAKVEINLQDLDYKDQENIARDSTTSQDVLDELLKITDSQGIFQLVLRNPNLSIATLLDYINHPYNYTFSDYMLDAFRNPNMPMEVLTNIDDYNFSEYLAFNDNTPVEILDQLIQKYPNDEKIIGSVVRNPKTPEYCLRAFAHDSSTWVRTMLACNESIPLDVQQILSQDPQVSVRGYLAQNPYVSVDILEQLATDESNHVRYEAQQSLNHRQS